MKIGLLVPDFNILKNWELRIIDALIINPLHSISLIIKDEKRDENRKNLLQSSKTKNNIKRGIFQLQTLIENKLYPDKTSVNKEIIFGQLIQIDTFLISSHAERGFIVYSDEDSEKIKAYDLDIIVKLRFDRIQGKITNSAKYGIWSLYHADCNIIKEGPVGFWEIIQNQPVIAATLYKLTNESDEIVIVDQGFYNRHWSFIQSENIVCENSVNLIIKNLNLFNHLNLIDHKPVKAPFQPGAEVPDLKYLSKYLRLFYRKSLKKILKELSIKLGYRPDGWAIFSSAGNIRKTDLSKCEVIIPYKSHFWADPFVFNYKNVNHLFFENYSYKRKKGKISTGVLENNKISLVNDVMDLSCHLSYPFIMQDNNEIFMVPETSQNLRLEIYKSTGFPLKWELYSTAFEGYSLVDTTIYTDSNNDVWLFTNRGSQPLNDCNCELYIYKIDSLRLNKIIPHKKNPVIIDCRRGRNAGPIYKDGDVIIRPSQNTINEIYGYGINLSIIKKLTLDEYEEEFITTIKPNFKKGLMATHHLCQSTEGFVIDGCYKHL